MNPTYDFTGQVALVTGAAGGVGLDTARAFATALSMIAFTTGAAAFGVNSSNWSASPA